MKIISKNDMENISSALIDAHTAIMQDVMDKWEMPVRTFTVISNSIYMISRIIGVDLISYSEKAYGEMVKHKFELEKTF